MIDQFGYIDQARSEIRLCRDRIDRAVNAISDLRRRDPAIVELIEFRRLLDEIEEVASAAKVVAQTLDTLAGETEPYRPRSLQIGDWGKIVAAAADTLAQTIEEPPHQVDGPDPRD